MNELPIKDLSWLDDPKLKKQLKKAQENVGGALELSTVCSYCKAKIPEDGPVYAVRIVATKDISHLEGLFLPLKSIYGNIIFTFVVPSDSETKQEGYDMLNFCCSKKCSDSIISTIGEEKELIRIIEEASSR